MSIDKPDKRKMFLASLCALAGVLSLGGAPALAACPNEELRTGSSSSLPDCRAYEQVSPVDKNAHGVYGGAPAGISGQAALAGGAIAYFSNGAFPGIANTGGVPGEYISTRGEAGWTTTSPLPPQTYSYAAGLVEATFPFYSPDLSKGVLSDATDSPALVPGEQETGGPSKASNLFLRDNATGAYSLINFPAPGLSPAPYQPTFDGASADFATVIFNAPAALTPEAPGGSGGGVENLYEWTGGVLSLVSQIPPAGQPSCGPAGPACLPAPQGGSFGGQNAIKNEFANRNTLVRAVSADGSRVFFTAEGNLYARQDAETTVRLDAPQGGSGPGGRGAWASAAADGSRVFFYDDASAGLTADTQVGSGTNLYEYDFAAPEGHRLADLTPGPQPGVQGIVNEASADGSYLYFVANAVLTSVPNSLGEAASPGNCQEVGQAEKACDLYVSHDGAVSFIHKVSGGAAEYIYTKKTLLGGVSGHNASRVTPDGRHLAFFAEEGGSGENGDPAFGELFEYSAESGQTTNLCACAGSEFRGLSGNVLALPQEIFMFQYTRALSDDGARVFFESYRSLLPRDTNGQPDVYQWEAQGEGTCDQPGGCLSLVSSGTSAEGSWFLDASASGKDVFFTTQQQLASTDADGAYDLYDARAEGGFASPPKPPECLGGGCLNVPPAPIDATPASLTFSGAGNLSPAQAAKPAAKSRTPKKKSKPKKKKRSGKGKAKAKRAGSHRKGAK
jgi:hypothetical protein